MKKAKGHQYINIKSGDVIRYVALPGIVPRIKAFSNSGFSWLAHLMAVIYAMVRLLPLNHPYLYPANMGKFGIRHVISEAAGNLKFNRNNIDQIIVFFALLAGFIILVLQFIMVIFMFLIKPVFAQAFLGMFDTPDPTNDIAFLLLDHVFGIPGFFCNVAGTCTSLQFGLPTPFHSALHTLFQFYSLAILLVAVLVFLYYVVVMVGETAQTGTPFGRRFSHIWAPLRLVVALGLLVPLNYGINSGQYIMLAAARAGSGFATNGWLLFNRDITAAWSTNDESLIARTNPADPEPLIAFMLLVSACKYSYERQFQSQGITILPYLVKTPYDSVDLSTLPPPGVYPYYNPGAAAGNDALTFYEYDDVIIRFGHKDDARYPNEKGGVMPYCGEIRVHTNDAFTYVSGGSLYGPLAVQAEYYGFVVGMTFNPEIQAFGRRAACVDLSTLADAMKNGTGFCAPANITVAVGNGDPEKLPTAEFLRNMTMDANAFFFIPFSYIVRDDYINALIADGETDVPADLLALGWGGAGIWYNRIAKWNGSFATAIRALPTPHRMPRVMEMIREERRKHDESMNALFRFQPYLSDGTAIQYTQMEGEGEIGQVLNSVYQHWKAADANQASDMQTQGNVFFDAMNAALGLEGLFDMRENKDVHPLAQLTAVGKGMIESSIRNLMVSLAFAVGGGAAQSLEKQDNQNGSATLNAMSGIYSSLTTVGLTVGFVLYYVLPFLPFLYFFFAVGGWVKGIFEAMVGIPLWALAHLRIDGEGLPSNTATNGYFLIFEIFVRPILTVFGLLASVVIFSATARVLNDVFQLITENLTGFELIYNIDPNVSMVGGKAERLQTGITGWETRFKRSVVDEFFYTVIYAILIYLMATASFKLIDQIPNSILRWMGAGVQSFGDQSGDPIGGLTQYAAIGGATMGGQVVGAATGAARAAGSLGGMGISALDNLAGRATSMGGAQLSNAQANLISRVGQSLTNK